MTVGHGFHATMTAQPGKREEVLAMLGVAPSLPHPDCAVFLFGISAEDDDTVYVTEGWTGPEEHRRFRDSAEAQDFITRLQPLLTGESRYVAELPVGGKAVF